MVSYVPQRLLEDEAARAWISFEHTLTDLSCAPHASDADSEDADEPPQTGLDDADDAPTDPFAIRAAGRRREDDEEEGEEDDFEEFDDPDDDLDDDEDGDDDDLDDDGGDDDDDFEDAEEESFDD